MREINIMFCLIFIFASNISFSQKINYFDLKYLFEHSVDEANDYIIKKGFEFHKTETEENGIDKSMTWSYHRDAYTDKAKSFIAKYKFDANTGFIWYQIDDVKTVDQIKTYCKSIGFKLKKSEIDPFGSLCSSYENSKFTIQFCYGLDEKSNRNIYTINFDNK